MNRCFVGDTRDGMRSMLADGVRVQTVVTSPPYWGLRDYGVDGQFGLEDTPAEYVTHMVEVFGLVRELLADDGTLFLNMGDCYIASPTGSNGFGSSGLTNGGNWQAEATPNGANRKRVDGLKPKDLVGMPWRLAFALQADGWYLRSDIIWHKPNAKPESVSDRPTKAHEYLFLLSKRARYYYDADAISEPASPNTHASRAITPRGWNTGPGAHDPVAHSAAGQPRTRKEEPHGSDTKNNASFNAAMAVMPQRRNKRTVWTIASEPFQDAHFATFPPALVEPCILAGSRVGDIVFDPFLGSGTVAMVAQRLGRKWLGCELSATYAAMIQQRTRQSGMLLEAAAGFQNV